MCNKGFHTKFKGILVMRLWSKLHMPSWNSKLVSDHTSNGHHISAHISHKKRRVKKQKVTDFSTSSNPIHVQDTTSTHMQTNWSCLRNRPVYRAIKKSVCTWWLQYRKLQVMFKVSPTILQTFVDTPNCVLKDRVQYSTVHILNVFCDGHLQIVNCVGIVRIHRVRCTDTFWSSCTTSRHHMNE